MNKKKLVTCIKQLADYVQSNAVRIVELEINPLFIYSDEVLIIDVFMQQYQRNHID